MKFNFAICDDNKAHLADIKNTICKLSDRYQIQVSVYTSANELLNAIVEAKQNNMLLPEFVMLDIELPDINGIELGKQIKQIYPEVCLVLVTSYAEYAVQGYEAKADRYLLKPIVEEHIESLLTEYIRDQGKLKKIIVKDKEQEHLIFIKDILYISAEDKYTILYTENNRYFDYKSLKEYEELLADYGFFRIHRKHIVNMYHHKTLKKGFVTLSNDTEIPVSRRREVSYREKLMKMLERDLL